MDANANTLPSPNQLKRKVLIKHKKLMVEGEGLPPERAAQVVPDPSELDFASFMSDLSNSRKNGYLFMQDPIDKVRGGGERGERKIQCSKGWREREGKGWNGLVLA